jgi:hypothetical protein
VAANPEYTDGTAPVYPGVGIGSEPLQLFAGSAVSSIRSTARILDTLQKKRGAGCYRGLDNRSWAD